MSETSNLDKGLFTGVKEIIDATFGADPSKHKFCSIGTALDLASTEGTKPTTEAISQLIESLWAQMVTNWVEGSCQWSGEDNWRWDLQLNLSEFNDHEIRLNRTLAQELARGSIMARWANEVPTASGLIRKGRPGGLDFAYSPGENHVVLIELKHRSRDTKLEKKPSGADNPVSAGVQVVVYGLFLVLARLVAHRIIPSSGKNIAIARNWQSATKADLRVLAPTRYFERYSGLGWFEGALDTAVQAFGAFGRRFGLEFTFGFRRFDEEPKNEQDLVAALNRKVSWS